MRVCSLYVLSLRVVVLLSVIAQALHSGVPSPGQPALPGEALVHPKEEG